MIEFTSLLLMLLLSVDPEFAIGQQGPAIGQLGGLQAPEGVETRARTDVRVPWSTRTQTWTSAPTLVTMDDVIRRAEERVAAGERPATAGLKGRIPGILPADVVDLMRLQAYALPPSERIDVAARGECTGPGRSLARTIS